MLVLARKRDQRIIIRHKGEVIAITVVENGVRDGKIRLGFDAPMSVSIHREEIDDRVQAEMPPCPKSASKPTSR